MSQTASKIPLTREQWRVIVVLWLAYTFYYIGRVNLSPALTYVAESLHISRAEVGVLGTAMFWAYAVGQLVNGELGNHFSPRKIIALGVGTIALVNLLFSTQTALLPMMILWGINGFAQSTGWGPMLRILAEHLDTEQRTRVSMPFSLSYQFGTAASWLLATLLVVWSGWQAAFLVPGCILLMALALWWWTGVDAPKTVVERAPFQWSSLWRDLVSAWRVMLVTAVMGIVYTSVNLWLPTYFADTNLFDSGFISVISSIMPLIGAVGMVTAAALLNRTDNALSVLRIFLVGILLSAALAAFSVGYLQVFFVSFIMFVMGSVSAMLTTSIPLMLASSGRASSTAGTINAIHYIGGGLAGVVVGGLVESGGWSSVFMLWAGCSLVALILLGLQNSYSQYENRQGNSAS
jgi:OPA family sugar phosphate sensor protein UhpC-like MFS transporter